MKLLRNPEVLKTLGVDILVSILASIAAYLHDSNFGIYVLCLCLLFIFIHMVTAHKRYRRISELSSDIDHVLHGRDNISFSKYAEGELGILQSEINKMTVRLREQQHRLQEDKVYLADSIADISHQIRTPLTSINLLVSLLSEPGIPEKRRQELTRELYELLSRIDWLITTLLKISKLDAGTVRLKKESISLAQLVQKAAAPLLIPIELREQELVIKAQGEFVGDISWTCEALTNVIKNCMEHTPEKGRIEITAEENALFSQITVADNGSGISPEDMPHIFERFYKGKNSDEKSFGVGLALARMIICSQNGTIKASNADGKGALFTIRFYKATV